MTVIRHLKNREDTPAGARLAEKDAGLAGLRVRYVRQGDGYVFQGLHEEGGPLEEGDYVTVPLSSVFQGVKFLPPGTEFSNILYSSGDRASQSWHILASMYGIDWVCHEETCVYDCYNGATLNRGSSSSVVGGHVLLCRVPVELKPGNVCYIVPISQKHNSINVPHTDPHTGRNRTPGNGNGFFMKIRRIKEGMYSNALVMAAYQPDPRAEEEL